MNPFDQQAPLPGINQILVVGSGKGGVGKSTVAANLAVALAKRGKSVGLLDADLYGPSQPRLFGCLHQRPEIDAQNRMIPLERYGVRLMSMGFLVEEDAAVIWRGPMLFKAMDQFLREVAWGELDYLVLDLPPGTGDVALTVAQKIPVNGAVVVLTPQNLALIDAKKAIDMFERVNIPVLGVVENMAYFQASPESPPTSLFPPGELNSYLEKKGLKKTGRLPFAPELAVASETGVPLVEAKPETEISQLFLEIARQIDQGAEGLR